MNDDQLRREIEALPSHREDGYDAEWRCDYKLFNATNEYCSAPEQHDDEMVSRTAVLRLIATANGR